jgi:hypothetical protein
MAYCGALLGYISWFQPNLEKLNIIIRLATSPVLPRMHSTVLAIVPSFWHNHV